MKPKIIVIYWAFNPDVKVLRLSLRNLINDVDEIIIVDNGSRNVKELKELATEFIPGKVNIVELSTLIRELENRGIDMGRFRVRVLKVDCKGCEYELVNDDSLRLFDIVKIEYSGYLVNETYHELMSSLEELGFRCRVWAHNELAIKIGLDRHGTMTCIKEGWGGC
jgi:hypothetical protein